MTLHLDEARDLGIAELSRIATEQPSIEKALLINDIFGHLRAVFWSTDESKTSDTAAAIDAAMRDRYQPYWGDGTLGIDRSTPHEVAALYAQALRTARVTSSPNIFVLDRYRSRTSWFSPPSAPIWELGSGPPIITFHSFKGGVGRTTALASVAIQAARVGGSVVVIDMDLDAPGVASLLRPDSTTAARWGVVDYLLEEGAGLDLADYFHTYVPQTSAGDAGPIRVFSAGTLDERYLAKLARVDLELETPISLHPLDTMLRRIRKELDPTIILVDSRAGLSPAAGLLLSGHAHIHVLVSTASAQSTDGLRITVSRLGADRLRAGQAQSSCVVVHSMIPDSATTGASTIGHFNAKAEDIFSENYYAKEPRDDQWDLSDLASRDAPHVPVPIGYRGALAFFTDITQIVDLLSSEREYVALYERLLAEISRLLPSNGEED